MSTICSEAEPKILSVLEWCGIFGRNPSTPLESFIPLPEDRHALCLFQNVFVEAVRAVVSPVTLRTAKENRKHLWNKMGLGDGRSGRRKACALM